MDPLRVSSHFNDPNADVSFVSSDKVIFKVYKKYLEFASHGFPLAESVVDDKEHVQLSESAEVLEILFQFVHPPSESGGGRQPSVVGMESSVFFAVASAAEKYIVYGAMNIFLTHMHDSEVMTKHPIKILNHAYKYDYASLADKAAYEALGRPLLEHAQSMDSIIMPQFIRYRDQWQKLVDFIISKYEDPKFTGFIRCRRFADFRAMYTRGCMADIRKATGLPAELDIPSICGNGSYCECRAQRQWQALLDEKVEGMKLFNQIVS